MALPAVDRSEKAYALYLAARERQFGADLGVIDSGSAHYFALALLLDRPQPP